MRRSSVRVTHAPPPDSSKKPGHCDRAFCVLGAVISTILYSFRCAATQVAISKHDLDVQTKMSDTIFLDPVADSKKTVFVQIRNTSDKPDFDIAADVKAAVSGKGYRIVGDPDHAQYILQANILQVGKVAPSAAQEAFGGYGAPLGGAFLGAATAASLGSTRAAPIAGAALAGGLIELVDQTRILSVSNKVNLDFAEAAPPLRSGLVRVIAGPF
ncbi:complement resistance protein TraT [Paraburkholderia sp. BR13439]|uniref:complement resistance protein TraT n=1 Tax=Paraburkholderia sp. BR13439 TaxID=3236996 RepID=UPI0034D0030C